jgi:hypothetical protein
MQGLEHVTVNVYMDPLWEYNLNALNLLSIKDSKILLNFVSEDELIPVKANIYN